uniref:nuclear intron maturase 4, mitochondrial n=1 Tax=Erigeron canadensis TaxID=72917 RepID=UPI001CB98E07|nr:nuclear intron maturase 4, mitochondrial [Erigeron canadensis]XP_043613463.1 nuclear intron maturase 4, mitochondrial [Erigeron canadensis]
MICSSSSRIKLVNSRIRHLQCFIFSPLYTGGKRYIGHSVNSSLKCSKISIEKSSLATNLASLVQEASLIDDEKKPLTRLDLKRFLEFRIKKRVKDQYRNGKFHSLFEKVIANPYTLQDAYNSIRVNSNVDLASECDDINFDSLAKELSLGDFDISSNVYSISTRGVNKETLVLPNLSLNIVQEAVRIALEVVYKPHYSKISHGCRSGRGHSSALKYIRKEISNANWWFTLVLNKRLDTCILSKLISTMETKIEDPRLFGIIHSMFEAGVLNMEFGGFAKSHGLPQEGILSPVLMNIYLDMFDTEIRNLSMKHEVIDPADDSQCDGSESKSKLRSWFRRQIDHGHRNEEVLSGVRVHCCRLMDEILVVMKGSKEVSLTLKSEIETYIRESLYLDFDSKTAILHCNDSRGVQFIGKIIKRNVKDSPAVRAVHKLKEKVELFALQKQEAWDEGTVRIGKKVLGHGFKRVKESEIKHLADSGSVLSQVSHFRKQGMETDHWYKVLLKVWMQHIDVKSTETEESIISKFIAEEALPNDLKDSFYTFQNHAKNYVSSETKSTLSLLPESSNSSESYSITEVIAPLKPIRMCLQRYGIINSEGYPRACQMLLLLDHDHIIDWFSGLVYRWLRWYSLCDNFVEVKLIITEKVRKSCIRTLATKYRLHESEIERKFDSDLNRIPLTEDFENDFVNDILEKQDVSYDEGLLYGIPYSGLCVLSLARAVSKSRPCTCFVIGCRAAAPFVYTVHVMQRQKFPVWKTGFSSSIHPSLHGRRIGLCKQHLKDLFLCQISLQSISFGSWK